MVANAPGALAPRCRVCRGELGDRLIDLGPQPDPDRLLGPQDDSTAPTAPIDLWLCRACCLVQLAGPRPSGPVPRHGHQAGGPPDAAPWPVDLLLPGLGTDRLVVDVDVADARTGRAFARHGFPVRGFSRQPDVGGGTDAWIGMRQPGSVRPCLSGSRSTVYGRRVASTPAILSRTVPRGGAP